MSSDYSLFYKELATGMNDMLESVNADLDSIEKVLNLLTYLVNLTTDSDFDVNRALLDIETVIRLNVYGGLNIFSNDENQILSGVLALNTHTKRYINPDLTDFVNNKVWLGSCVPFEWGRASELTGENIINWNICTPS